MAVHIQQSISKLRLLQGTLAEPTIHDVTDTTTGVNWFGNDDVGFVSTSASSFQLKNGGYLQLSSALSAVTNIAILRLDRITPTTTAGRYSSIDFTSNTGANATLSLRAVTESSGNHGFQLKTAASSTFNTLPAISVLSNNKIGFNVVSPLFKFHLSDTGAVMTAAFVDTSLAVITNQGTDSPALTLVAYNDQNTTRGVIKGVKAKGTTVAPTAVTDTNYTLSLLGAGYDGTSNLITAAIDFLVNGTVATNTMPQAIVFKTGATTTATERMRINPDGNVGIGATAPAAKLNVSGGIGAGSSYNTTAVPNNALMTTRVGVGASLAQFTADTVNNIFSYSGSSTHNHIKIETPSGSLGHYIAWKNASSALLSRIGLVNLQMDFDITGSQRVYLNATGFRYAADYSASYTDRSLVDKEYVDNAVMGGGGGGGITSLGGQTGAIQTFSVSTTGTDFLVASSGDNHEFRLPDASATARGVITTGAQVIAGVKTLNSSPILNSLSASLPLKINGSKTIISALIDLTTDVTGILPIANGGTGASTQGWVDLTTTQTNIGGTKGFTAGLYYGNTSLPTSSNFGTTLGTKVFFAGSTTAITESNFNNTQGFIISNEIDSGTQVQTLKLIAAGSDTFNTASHINFLTRRTGVGQNWATNMQILGSGKILMGTVAGTKDTTLHLGPYATSTSGNVGIAFEHGSATWTLEATAVSEAFRIVEGVTTRAHIQLGVNDWISGSDIKLKKEIEELTVLPYINTVKGASYKLIKGADKRVIGVIAQDIEQYFPEAVFPYEETDGTELKGVSYDAIAAIALQGVKELKQYIDILEGRITDLEKQIRKLNK